MTVLILLSFGGLIAGIALLRRVPSVPVSVEPGTPWIRVSIVIPARNEEKNLARLLTSLLNAGTMPWQVLVVDDGSTDHTAAVAARCGATVIASASLPQGWTGKTWACHQGALAATGEVLFFLDADTWFVDDGYRCIVKYFVTLPNNTAASVLPFQRMECWYEELSLVFSVLVAMGAGGFGGLDNPRLFGQSLLIRRELYRQAGGHESVKREVLENLHFAAHVQAIGGKLCTLGGRGTLEMRMFPDGLSQLRESWQKAFVTGARTASPVVLGLSIYWLGSAMFAAIMLIQAHGTLWQVCLVLYVLNAVEMLWFSRQLGTSRWLTALLYPVPLIFYFSTFVQSVWQQRCGGKPTWRGRQL
jgi:4,4'-diaponeurosporenoate glycosyltransferase